MQVSSRAHTVLGPSSDTHPECNRVCVHDQSPVCGDNGKLYTNKCFLDYDNCVAGEASGSSTVSIVE
ncbi:hypothetical protein Pcinc_028851 [Petrolisthes cinctipes]|uniref:Kazal-like domain-containing protein n=1 Tax=Petrolisthes cinctipes TaxID=88211 RepID=A0AAE1F2B7_PETCI|nr:hypothetical protein Pcinc_028851 [Petrolisthes cinctipes]